MLEFRYPCDLRVIQRWAAGDPPDIVPAEYGVVTWDTVKDLDVSLFTQGRRAMRMTLFNQEQEIIGEAVAGDGISALTTAQGDAGHIHVDDLEPGTYVLAFEGNFETVYSVSVGSSSVVYLPLVVKD